MQFLYNARGSVEEVRYFLLLSKDLGYLKDSVYEMLERKYEGVSKLLNGLLKSLLFFCMTFYGEVGKYGEEVLGVKRNVLRSKCNVKEKSLFASSPLLFEPFVQEENGKAYSS